MQRDPREKGFAVTIAASVLMDAANHSRLNAGCVELVLISATQTKGDGI